MTDDINEIKKLVKTNKLIIGSASTLKKLRNGKLEKIWLSLNTPNTVKDELVKYANISKTSVIQLSIPNDEFGVICKKQFSVSVVSVLKGEK
jgi:ribosomal protein L30E